MENLKMVAGWIVLFAPLVAFFGIILLTQRSKSLSAGLAIGSLALSLASSITLLMRGTFPIESSFPWVNLPRLSLEFGILLDPLSILMSLVVTGVGLMIFIYSVGYMANESGFVRYFAFLSLFAFSMLGIVLANNFVTLFICWELVGASSYLLIGYWYERPRAAEAGKKAFLVNRIADFGFLLGILMLWSLSGVGEEMRTLNFTELQTRLGVLAAQGVSSPQLLSVIAALIFCGVVGKSAQFPLHVWLPDAMEGPTPVSALIHAATMVAAGVYLLARVFFLFEWTPQVMEWIALVGGLTAFFAATLALVENDLKRILAYSTLSQLGYMVMALGLGGAGPGMYHLTTHACFKALLFMGAGCVIHALNTNDIWEMGGLRRLMPVTFWTFLLATLALCGLPPFSGFFSKDEILTLAFAHHPVLWVVGTLTAGLTAFYMGRLFSVAFLGSPKPGTHPHEAPPIMTLPLIPLSILSVIGGFLGVPEFLLRGHEAHLGFNPIVAITSSLVAFSGFALSLAIYRKVLGTASEGTPHARRVSPLRTSPLRTLLVRKYYVDDVYAWINQNIQQRVAILLSLFERYVVIGLWVNGTAKITGFTGHVLRLAQTGKVQAYALTLLAGLALLIYFSQR